MSNGTNARTPVENSMPLLKKACATFKGFAAGEKCGERVFQMLLPIIQRCRGAEPKRFYTIREVAEFFGVAHGTVETVFRRLGHEGALTVVRSSQTMIPARVSRPRFAIRGVVCMPIWLPGFLQFLDWRISFSHLEDELSRYRFVLQPIFYQQGEDSRPDFVDRILKFNPDYLFWHQPIHRDVSIMQSIADTGVPLLVTQDTMEPFPLAGRIYWQSNHRGLQEGLREWKASGAIDQIIVPQQAPIGMIGKQSILTAIETCGLPYQTKNFPSGDPLTADFSPLKDYLRRLAPKPRTGIIFGDDLFYCRLCERMPDAMLKLFANHRVMVMREVKLPSLTPPPKGLTVDTLLLPGKQLARCIASDLNKGLGGLPSQKIIFEAEWRPKTLLTEVTHRL